MLAYHVTLSDNQNAYRHGGGISLLYDKKIVRKMILWFESKIKESSVSKRFIDPLTAN